MFLFLNALVASLDGFIIGIGIRLAKVKISVYNILYFLIENILIYSLFLYLYIFFHITFVNKIIATLLYLILAFRSLKIEEVNYKNKLSIFEWTLLAFSHSLDGILVSLNFVYTTSLFKIVSIFSIFAVTILLLGYYFANFFKKQKKGNKMSFVLFILLAILNLLD